MLLLLQGLVFDAAVVCEATDDERYDRLAYLLAKSR
jgi:hypothetical protein